MNYFDASMLLRNPAIEYQKYTNNNGCDFLFLDESKLLEAIKNTM